MPLADWTVPFELTSALFDPNPLPINTDTGSGIYLLRPEGCSLGPTVRATKEDIPQASGSILHDRYLTGTEMTLAVQLWGTINQPACDTPDLQQEMLDTFMGYAAHLLNAGDNEGRISWAPSGTSERMLDDIRLLSYPTGELLEGVLELTMTIDTRFPYSMELTELQAPLDASEIVMNIGNLPTYPVFQLDGPFSTLILANTTTGAQWTYDAALPGAASVGPTDYIEIDTFRNTAYLNGNGANMKAGIDPLTAEFFPLAVGANTLTLSGDGPLTGLALVNGAYA